MTLKRVEAGDLLVSYYDLGDPGGQPVILLHGFPYDAHAYCDVADLLTGHGFRCIVPFLRGYGPTTFRSAETMRSGQQAAIGSDLKELMDALEIPKAILGGFDWGGRAACIVAALWPERVLGLVSCGQGYNIQNIAQSSRPAAAVDEARYWYQYLFNMSRGVAALEENRNDICRHLWKTWSSTWSFDEKTFARTATAFENPDFVDIVIHSYRHRYGTVAGDPRYEDIEALLAGQPSISVNTIVVQGRDDGVDPPGNFDHDQPHFIGDYRRLILNGVGHNPPQEAPSAFAEAIQALSI